MMMKMKMMNCYRGIVDLISSQETSQEIVRDPDHCEYPARRK